jgi:hypothetical protein
MPQLVDVPTVGTVEFPDGMGERDIALAIYRNYPHLRPDRQAVDLPPIQSQEDFNALPEAHQQIVKAAAGFRNQFPELLTPNTDTLTPTPGARRVGVPLKGRAPTVRELFLGPGENIAPEDRPANLEERFAPEPAAPTAPLYEKTAKGLARGSLRAADAMNPMLVMAAPAIPGGVAGRVIGAGFAATQAKSAFDAGKEMVAAVKANDPERFTAALVTGGVGAFFAYHGAKGAVAPGLANESPWVRSLVEKQIETEYSPAQLKEIYGRVNQGKATPEEESLVRFINESPEPGQAVRQGVTTVQPQPTGVFGDYMLARGRFARNQPAPMAPQPEEANATATREEPVRVQPERERVDEELQSQGQDRQQPPVQPQESPQTIAGNRLPAVGAAIAPSAAVPQSQTAKDVEKVFQGLAKGGVGAFRQRMVEQLKNGQDVRFTKLAAINAARKDQTLVLRDNPDGSVSVVAVKGEFEPVSGLSTEGGDVSGQEKQKQEGQVPVLNEPPPVVPAAPPVATRSVPVPKVAAVKPVINPADWRVTVQQPDPQVLGSRGYVQLDQLTNGQNVRSASRETLAKEGIQTPDFSGLPQGQYPMAEAMRMLTAKKKEDHTQEQSRQGPALAPREQKKYLLAELDKAIGEAPDEAPASGPALEHEKQLREAMGDGYDPNLRAQQALANAGDLFATYDVPTHTQVPAELKDRLPAREMEPKERLETLRHRIDVAIAQSRPHVTIHVPGDGTFSVVNRKVSLEQFRKEVSKRFPVSTPSAPSERRLPEPTKLPTVKENLTVVDAVKALDTIASTAPETRFGIHRTVMADGKQLVATDGHRMLVVTLPGLPGTAEKPVILDSRTGKPSRDHEQAKYPAWQQVIPKESEPVMKYVPTDSLFGPLKAALVLQKDHPRSESVKLYKNMDGSAGISTKVPEVGEYEHNLQSGAIYLGTYNTEKLLDGITTARQLGSANVGFEYTDDLTPLVIIGKHSKYILMPMRAGQLGAAVRNGLESEMATEPVSAIGVEEIRNLVSRDMGLPEPVRKAMLAMLDSPVMRDLDWTGLKLELRDRIEGGFGGAATGQLIEMSRQESSPSTFPHEVFHLLWQLLPPHVRTEIDAMRVRSMQAEMQTIGDPNARQQVASLFSEWAHQPWTSDQFMQLMEALRQSDPQLAVGLPDFYHLLNPSEFLSWFASERFGQEQAAKEGQHSLWQKIKDWLAGLLKALKGMLNLKRNGMEQIYQDLLAGKYRNTVASGVEYERQASLAKPSKGETTQVMGEDEYVRSRPHLTPESHAASLSKAKQLFDAAGVPVIENAALGGWEIQNDGFEHNIEGRKLAGLLEKEIGLQNQPGKAEDYLASVLNSIVLNFEAGKMDQVFDLTVRNKLFEVSQSERSFRGRMLSALAQFGKGMEFVARNPDVVLGRIYSDAFGGDQLRAVMGRMLDEFRGYFTDAEIEQALKDTPDLQRTVDQLVALNRRDEGGRVYRRVQQLLKPKSKAKLAKLEANARVEEAARDILQQAAKQGIEPKPNPNKKLSALQRLLLMVDPKTSPKIQALVDKAVKDAEHNAGVAAALKEAPDNATRSDLEGRFAAGEEPTDEQVESGLSLPQFSHWRVIRDNLLGYSPVTLKLAGEVVPKLKELIKQVFETPFYRQADLKENFADVMGKQLGVTEEQMPSLWKAFEQAFDTQLQKARQKAVAQIRTSMLPAEKAVLDSKLGKSGAQLAYQAVERLANVYDWSMDEGELLLQIARAKGQLTMSKEELKTEFEKIRALVDREEHLRELTDKEKEGLTEKEIAAKTAEKAAFNDGTRAALKKEMAVRWARITKPINLPMASKGSWSSLEGAKKSWVDWFHTRRNFAAAADEWAAGGLLLKIGFPTRQLVQVASQMLTYTPGRALAQAEQLHKDAIARGEPSALLELISMQLKDGYVQRTAAIRATVAAIRASAMGRSEQRNVDRLMSGIAALDRLQLKADEFIKRGEVGRGRLLQALALQRLGYKVAQALDQMQGVPAEFQERRYLVIRELRQSGMSLAEARLHADFVIGDMNLQFPLAFDRAQAMAQQQGETLSNSVLKERAWQLVRVWQVERMKALQLPVDDFAARIELLKNTLGYNEPETKGLGGLVALSMNAGRKLTQEAGLPTALFPFGNAIGITINRLLAFTPFYWQANIGPGESGWFHTEEDRRQRRWEGLAIGPIFGGILALLVALGYWVVRGSYPKDEQERELWDAQGIRPHTLEVPVGDGHMVLSLNNSPITPFSPYLAGAGALVDLLQKRQKQQDKLNDEAAKLGLQPGTIRPMDMADMLGVAASAAYQTVMGGRTASGLIGSLSDFGQLNVTKALASRVSPFVPGLPALQEVSRMGGVVLDTKMASFWDFMLPLPSSGARKVNMLGDPVGTMDAAQRVFQVLTGGSYPYVANDQGKQAAAYASLFASGYRPPSVNPGKGYNVNGTFRPLNDEELAKYTALRGELAKQRLTAMGVTDDPKAVQAVFQQANAEALQSVGVTLTPRQEQQAIGSQPTSGGVRTAAGAIGGGAVGGAGGGLKARASSLGRGLRRGLGRVSIGRGLGRLTRGLRISRGRRGIARGLRSK